MVDRSSPLSLYLQLKQALSQDIRNGKLKVGEKMPSVRTLITTYKVSMPVVRKALSEMEEEGVITIEHGRGSFINCIPSEDALFREPEANSVLFLSCTFEICDPFYSRVLMGAQDEAAVLGVNLIYAHPTEQRPVEVLLSTSDERIGRKRKQKYD